MSTIPTIRWPENKKFAFTIFDDPDAQSEQTSRQVYGFLANLGFRTTKGVWPLDIRRERNSGGDTCATGSYRDHCLELQAAGFELGFHNAAPHSSTREETIEALDVFRRYFGQYPSAMANHYNEEAIYWGSARLSGPWRAAYSLLMREPNRFYGHIPGHPSFWGDVCCERIRYCRNFVFADINTLRQCPFMPYHDPNRAFVNKWYASSEGANCISFVKTISELHQDRLEREGGACIMYTHFGHGFTDDEGNLHPRFQELMQRLSLKGGWFVPVSTLLDYLEQANGKVTISDAQRAGLERRWFTGKIFRGTS